LNIKNNKLKGPLWPINEVEVAERESGEVIFKVQDIMITGAKMFCCDTTDT
jgi:hypothetical protein